MVRVCQICNAEFEGKSHIKLCPDCSSYVATGKLADGTKFDKSKYQQQFRNYVEVFRQIFADMKLKNEVVK